MSDPIFGDQFAPKFSTMGAQSGPATVAPRPENVPQEPSRPRGASIQNEIDRLVGNTLPQSVRVNRDGSAEHLPTGAVVSANTHNANVVEPPSLDSLMGEVNGHQAHITHLQQRLNAVTYSRTTGEADGYVVTGAAREQLEKELARRGESMGYTVNLIEQTSAARIAWNQHRAEQATSGEEAPGVDAMEQAARRENAIKELAEMRVDGKSVGRVEAARKYDEAQLRARADKLARR